MADHDEKNGYTVYAKTWSTIFSEFKLRHDFIYQKLRIERKAAEQELNAKPDGTASEVVENIRKRSSSIDDNDLWQSEAGIKKLQERLISRKV